jgi:hypothetical protein
MPLLSALPSLPARLADPILPRGADKTAGLRQCVTSSRNHRVRRRLGRAGGRAPGVIRENASKAAERLLASRAA